MNLQQFEYVDAVARHRSLRSAAEALGLSPQALSRALVALERELGTDIFERVADGVVFTPIGAVVHRRAVSILRLRDQIVEAGSTDVRSRLTLGIGYYFTLTGLGEAVHGALSGLELARIDYVQGANVQLAPRVASGEVDLAFTSAISAGPRMVFRPWLEFGWAIAHRKDHPIARSGDLAQAAEFGFASAHSPNGHEQVQSAIRKLTGKTPRIVAVTESTLQGFRLLARSDLLAMMPEDVSPALLEGFGLSLTPLPDLPRREYGALTCRRPPPGVDWPVIEAAVARGFETHLAARSAVRGGA